MQPLSLLKIGNKMKIKELEKEIFKHNIAYWDNNDPLISDEEYDKLTEELKAKKPNSPVLNKMGPAHLFGAPVKHDKPMLSLDKKYDTQGIFNWYKTFPGRAIVTPKMDGLAVSIHYDNKGRLYLAATRGDGIEGDNITDNVKTIKDIPHHIYVEEIGGGSFEIRGEIYMKLSDFAKYKKDYSNPRNLAAGAMRHKDPKKCASVSLSFAAYDIISNGKKKVVFHAEERKLYALGILGFPPMDFDFVDQNEIKTLCKHWTDERDNLDYEIDGIVFKANRIEEQERMGHTSHHPKYAMAYKFQGDTGFSKILDVEWSVSRTGTITPVAIIEPLELSGAEITRVSLHNMKFISDLGLFSTYPLGSTVSVTRRGGVIPQIESVTESSVKWKDLKFVKWPKHCPSCGSETNWMGDFLYCSSKPQDCEDRVVGTIEHFCKVIDIQGFGVKLIQKLVDSALVSSPDDLYKLSVADLITLPRVGEKLAKKLVKEVDDHSIMPLSTFLRSLGIHELGKHVSKILEEKCVTLEAVMNFEGEEMANIPTIGDTIALSVVDGLFVNQGLINELTKHIIITQPEKEKQSSDRLQNLSFLFTGKLLAFSRKDAQEMVKDQGGDAPSSITKSLNFLVIGDGSKAISSKQKKALKFNEKGSHIQIIDETRFLEMIG